MLSMWEERENGETARIMLVFLGFCFFVLLFCFYLFESVFFLDSPFDMYWFFLLPS
jgi:hypothetical protein